MVEYTAVNPQNFLWLFQRKFQHYLFHGELQRICYDEDLEKLKLINRSITKLENFAHNVHRIYQNAPLKRAAAHESRSLLRT